MHCHLFQKAHVTYLLSSRKQYFVRIMFWPLFSVSPTCFRVSTWLFIFCHLLGWSNFSHLLTPYGRLRRQKLDALLPHSASQHFCTSFCNPPLNQRLMNDIAYYWTALNPPLLALNITQRLLNAKTFFALYGFIVANKHQAESQKNLNLSFVCFSNALLCCALQLRFCTLSWSRVKWWF